MRIQGTNHVTGTNPYNKNQAKTNLASKSTKQTDQLTISAEAKALLEEVNSKYHLERQAKVEQLKEKIASGNYKIEADKIADKLLEWWK